MKNKTKSPTYQKLPTLEGLASRRGQTVQQLLEQNNVRNVAELARLLHRENMTSENSLDSYFASAKSNKLVSAVAPVVAEVAHVVQTKEVAQQAESVYVKKENKKVRKDRHSYDAESDRGANGTSELAVDETKGS